jgi:hypothetical protein
MGCIHSAPKHGGRGSSLGGRGRAGGPPHASDSEIRDRIECSPAAVTTTVGTTTLRYAYLSQRGYYPDGALLLFFSLILGCGEVKKAFWVVAR